MRFRFASDSTSSPIRSADLLVCEDETCSSHWSVQSRFDRGRWPWLLTCDGNACETVTPPGDCFKLAVTLDDGVFESNVFDRREDAANRVEAYLNKGSLWEGFLFENHITGQRSIQLFQREGAPLPPVGKTLYLDMNEGTGTEFSQRSGNDKNRLFTLQQPAKAEAVAAEAYRAMQAGTLLKVHGFANWLGVVGAQVGPRSMARKLARAMNLPGGQ